jgi:hypothetical protein
MGCAGKNEIFLDLFREITLFAQYQGLENTRAGRVDFSVQKIPDPTPPAFHPESNKILVPLPQFHPPSFLG